jgi:2-polyprenyl-6-methoxyphenol hydroxylase-like FAD-dependent oxidoreductase
MSTNFDTDVIVIGAGPVGLTLACELKRHGVSVRLVERKSKADPHPNAAVVHVRTLEILSFMGAVEGFLKKGHPLREMNSRAFGKRIGSLDPGSADSPYPEPRTLGQQHTERFLSEHLERLGGEIERGVEAVGVEQDASGVRVRLKHLEEGDREETVTAAWVVGCEGSKSITREAANIPFEGKHYAGKEFLQIDAKIRWAYPNGEAYQFLEKEHIVFCFPYDGDGFYRIIAARTDKDPENKVPPTLEEMQAILQSVTDPSTELYEPTWFNRFRSGHKFAPKFREGRAFIAGDAAHVHVPLGGQGMNYGIHDAFNLGWKLAAVIKGEARPSLLETYEGERHPVDHALVKGTDRGFHLMIEHAMLAGRTMSALGPLLFEMTPLRHWIRDTLGELNVAYPHSALTEDHGGNSGPEAGRRAPDAKVVRLPERETVTLFQVMHGTRWTLLLFAGLSPTADELEELEKLSASLSFLYAARVGIHLILGGTPPVPVHENWAAKIVMDTEQYAHAKYGTEGTVALYLIRPDGYIGFRGGLEEHARLVAYLKRVFI